MLVALDAVGGLYIEMREQADRVEQRAAGEIRHFHRRVAAFTDCKRGREQEALVEQDGMRVVLCSAGLHALVAHGEHRELLELLAEREKDNRGDQVECGVHHGNHKRGDRLVGKGEIKNTVGDIKAGKADDCADHVEVDVHGRHALRVFRGADRGEQRRDAGADILAHDDRQRHN